MSCQKNGIGEREGGQNPRQGLMWTSYVKQKSELGEGCMWVCHGCVLSWWGSGQWCGRGGNSGTSQRAACQQPPVPVFSGGHDRLNYICFIHWKSLKKSNSHTAFENVCRTHAAQCVFRVYFCCSPSSLPRVGSRSGTFATFKSAVKSFELISCEENHDSNFHYQHFCLYLNSIHMEIWNKHSRQKVLLFLFVWCWAANPGPSTCWSSALALSYKSSPQNLWCLWPASFVEHSWGIACYFHSQIVAGRNMCVSQLNNLFIIDPYLTCFQSEILSALFCTSFWVKNRGRSLFLLTMWPGIVG